jgi:hypothetical protein
VRWYLNMVLICIFFVRDVEHFFMSLLAIWTLKKLCSVHFPISSLGH